MKNKDIRTFNERGESVASIKALIDRIKELEMENDKLRRAVKRRLELERIEPVQEISPTLH